MSRRTARVGRTPVASTLVLVVVAFAMFVRADSVGQVQTAKRISRATVAVIDPERGTSTGRSGDVRVGIGDVLTFVFQFTPVPNGAARGLGGYITEYVPPNTEVVGARLIDRAGRTVFPHRGGLAADGWGPRGSNDYSGFMLLEGSISQLYADTGIFYSSDPRTARVPATQLITVTNGIAMVPAPTGAGQLDGLVGVPAGSPVFAHNRWDWLQVMAFGSGGAIGAPPGGDINRAGSGNTPFGYGSAVAGPETFYRFEATEVMPGVIRPTGAVGPWQRVRTPGAETGRGVAATTAGTTEAGVIRVGVPTNLGWDLSTSNPLPRATNAVRFAVGELVVGDEYFAEISLRVLATPLDPGLAENANCSEVFGGDASARATGAGGKDNTWRYYVPSPACVALNLFFELSVDRILALVGDTLTYTIDARNLSTLPQTNVRITDTFDPANVVFISATGGGVVAGNVISWPAIPSWAPSATFRETVQVRVTGGGRSTLNTARYVSNERPAGFSTTALTDIGARAIITFAMTATPSTVVPPGRIRLSGTIRNTGNGIASAAGCAAPGCQYIVTLPAGFTIVSGSSQIGGVAAADPTLTTGRYIYRIGLRDVPASGGTVTLVFDADVAGGTPTGLGDVCLETWLNDTGFGQTINDSTCGLVTVAVGMPRAAAPVLDTPIATADTCVSGTSTEPDGTTIRVFVNGTERGTATAMGGRWRVCGIPSLYGGQEITATAEGAGRLRSAASTGVFVTGTATPACNDGRDNDGDSQIDWPADPGCTGPTDSDETDVVTQCSDGMDNDGDGRIDLADNGCCGRDDTVEGGAPQCTDGMDNDGDGRTDFPTDTGCRAVDSACEIDLTACQNGLDDDADGLMDFPADPGCHAAIDDDERAPTTADTGRPRLLLIVDTSGSMTFDVAGTDSPGDGSAECPTVPANRTRLSRVRRAVTNVVNAFGEPEYALMRFRQAPRPFSCGGLFPAGGWDGAGAAPCGALNAGDLLVGFSTDNARSLLRWVDGQDNYTGTPPPGFDVELRGSGATPLAGAMRSARTYVDQVRRADARVLCRPYRVILLTDGAETCDTPVAAQAAAAALCALGAPVTVIGFAAMALRAELDAIAMAGCTSRAVVVDDEVALAAVLTGVVGDSILVERCNGLDDDCDGLIDEDFPDVGRACDNGQLGTCRRPGARVCTADGRGTMCNAPPGTPGVEICNGLDDNCNGMIDEGLMGCTVCPREPEVCNGRDDDCDGLIDEDFVPTSCGSPVGVCRPGMTACVSGRVECHGGTGPSTEVCNGLDDDCDGVIDGQSERCYTGTQGCDLAAGTCVGGCRFGFRVCTAGMWGVCTGQRLPEEEVCNCLDDNCNNVVDEGTRCPGGAACVDCSCARICDPALEFPCPSGFVCVDRFCVPDPCARVSCPAGQECQRGVCVDRCTGVTCPVGDRCANGRCVDDTCATHGCPMGEFCVDRMCRADRCVGVNCPSGQRCVPRAGGCVADDVCDRVNCPPGQVCDIATGGCIPDPCQRTTCMPPLVCAQGRCVANRCDVVQCSSGTNCVDGRCVSGLDSGVTPPGRLLATGSGGCACRVAASPPRAGAVPFALAALAAWALRRMRRRPGR